ncbi:PspC domain-containing protein [Paenibacillus mucilaginosus]|uniref:Phage-shock protein n=2 Tax=Paenibacillus mucilaginosus TaxID=61624 RepID=I0BCF0_9BACL|nr:PspC domain-containing protein [Paenibacillus mucilaginosus]AEI42082.1 phage shock protein C, PspC [Paenibacillus mucilaginosus KNP414]AFH60047.1 phage-shock protein [Paenibacillus mucilaginosus K02]MCG7214069.1 PspC domain-containing protein [Paenibacillus mucilaginosus]WDM28592.1 PspC domain-containing protein [Paenibacillus mucilaginosus]
MTRLFRSRTDRKITGLCGGLGEVMNVDPTLLRLTLVVTTVFTGGAVIPLYFIATLVIPNEPWNGGFGGGYGGPQGHGPGPGHGSYHSWKDWRRAEKHYRKAQKYGWGAHQEAEYAQAAGQQGPQASDLDDMMKDIEKKAMWKELEELRSKVAMYEKQQNQTKGDV